MLNINPKMLPRLEEIENDLLERRARAEREGWAGEIERRPGTTIAHLALQRTGRKPAGGNRSIAIVDETSQITSYISRISYAFAVNDEDPDSRAVFVASVVGANVCTGGLQMAEMFISRTD
ncbi:hypothetical protein [Nocardia sp. NPDC046763]|uniref:hypothetical protein n=1 Tax=Nocardia sp. NPDC046763 TaxID=3155256 RepID=UPI00340747D5